MSEKRHRLVDVEIDEISAVDKAANRRTFLILKRHHEELMGMAVEKREDTPKDAAWKKIIDMVDVEIRRLWVAGDSEETREETMARMLQTPAGKQLYTIYANASDDIVKGLTTDEYQVFAKSGFKTFRDLIWAKMETLAKVEKEKNPKLTKWQANELVLNSEVGKDLYGLYIAQESMLPPGPAISKLVKLYRVPVTELLKNVL